MRKSILTDIKKWFNARESAVQLGAAMLFMIIVIISLAVSHANHTAILEEILVEIQTPHQSVFMRGESQYNPTREVDLDDEEMELFARILVLETSSTNIAEVSAVGCVYLNQYERYSDRTFIEILQKSPSYAHLSKFEDAEYLNYINEHGIYRTARLVADDLVNHNYRPFDADVLHYDLIDSKQNLQNIFGNPVYETEHFLFFSAQD